MKKPSDWLMARSKNGCIEHIAMRYQFDADRFRRCGFKVTRIKDGPRVGKSLPTYYLYEQASLSDCSYFGPNGWRVTPVDAGRFTTPEEALAGFRAWRALVCASKPESAMVLCIDLAKPTSPTTHEQMVDAMVRAVEGLYARAKVSGKAWGDDVKDLVRDIRSGVFK